MDYLQAPITIYKNVRDNVGTPGTFYDFIALCLTSAATIQRLRAEPDPDKQKELKLSLPAAALCGRFAPTRSAANLVEPSKLMCIDIDHCDTERVLNFFRGCVNVLFAARSCRGNGVFAVIPITDPKHVKEHYAAFARWLLCYGIQADMQCKDIARMRVVSYDDPNNLVLHTSAVPFTGQYTPPPPPMPKFTRTSNPAEDERRVAAACREIKQRGIDIVPNYDDWLTVGFALATLGESGREYFHVVSSVGSSYSPRECDLKFDNLLASGNTAGRKTTISTFFGKCRDHGVNVPKSNA